MSDSISQLVQDSLHAHQKRLLEYETAGKWEAARELRAVVRLLSDISNGKVPETIMPGVSGEYPLISLRPLPGSSH